MMKRRNAIWMKGLAGVALMGLLAGCNDDCGGCGVDVALVVEGPPVVLYPYTLAVLVSDVYGYTLGGATVELTVAMVPERRFVAATASDGVAVFYFDAPPDVVAIAYACAPGYQCNAADIGTRPDRSHLSVNVVLR